MTDVSVALAEVLHPLRELDSKLELEETQLQAKLTELRAERKRLTQVLRTLAPKAPAQPSRKGAPKAAPKGQVSEARIGQVAAVVAGLSDEYSASQLKPLLPGLSPQTIRAALYVLRDRGLIRMTGIHGMGGAAWFRTTAKLELDETLVARNGPEPS